VLTHQLPKRGTRDAGTYNMISPTFLYNKRFFRVLHLATFVVLAFGASPLQIQADQTKLSVPKQSDYRIAIHCSRKVLQVWCQTDLIREYPIEIGKTGTHKQRSGDRRTPVGDYEITWMASRHSEKGRRVVDNESWCIENNFTYAKSGPSLEKLWTDSYGGDQAVIISINYPNSKDRQRGFTGECIHIHADKKTPEGMLEKSYGCIHMFPADAIDLYDIVDTGTPVKILP